MQIIAILPLFSALACAAAVPHGLEEVKTETTETTETTALVPRKKDHTRHNCCYANKETQWEWRNHPALTEYACDQDWASFKAKFQFNQCIEDTDVLHIDGHAFQVSCQFWGKQFNIFDWSHLKGNYRGIC